ncbi:MAG: PIG-L family deacetylase [Armatimonadetes bacterium]|nr:PIG-L family deacetylase [Armatimonadota bacterium]MDW8153891.1 PIG-L deacetylase family protein [Armatimonadota bacterium]
MHRLLLCFAQDRTAELEAGSTLVLAPHPDDEVLGCGGLIARKVRRGFPVWVAYLTDGCRGVRADPSTAAALREGEAREAAAVLGVSPHHQFFLRFPDGRLSEFLVAATERVAALVRELGVRQLFAPYRREYHPDHLAAYRLARACLRPGMRLYEYPVWFGPWMWRRLRGRARVVALSHLRDAGRVVRADVSGVLELKRRALGAYRSQVAEFDSSGWGSAFLRGFLQPYELFFEGP